MQLYCTTLHTSGSEGHIGSDGQSGDGCTLVLGVMLLVIAVVVVIMLVVNHKPGVSGVADQQGSTTSSVTSVTTTWPSATATDAKSVRLRQILKVIKGSHPLSVDPAKEWSLVDGGDGIACVYTPPIYVLIRPDTCTCAQIRAHTPAPARIRLVPYWPRNSCFCAAE